MTKLFFLPFGIVGKILAGTVGKRAFTKVWAAIDHEDAPTSKRGDVPWSKLLGALVLQGAITHASRGAFDRGARETFRWLTGFWVGEKPASK
jgi:Protein of unknown function (DUF4235)